MTFLRALSKMGLVELSPEEITKAEKTSRKSPEMSLEEVERLLAEDAAQDLASGKKPVAAPAGARSAPAPGVSGPAPAQGAKAASASGVMTGRAFDEIFRSADLPASPYPAEKLLKLLDGLAVMDEHTRRTAVLAMDAADDAWTIADPVVDAKRKMNALSDAKTTLDGQLASAEQKLHAEIGRIDSYIEEAKKTIHEKITSLQTQLEQELAQTAERRASMNAQFNTEKGAGRLEHERLDAEIARLSAVPRTFEPGIREPPKS